MPFPRWEKFRREYPIPPYTADFCCVALKLIVELDGEHHQAEEAPGSSVAPVIPTAKPAQLRRVVAMRVGNTNLH